MSDSFKINKSVIIQTAAARANERQTGQKGGSFVVNPTTHTGGSFYAKKAALAEDFPKFTLAAGKDSFRSASRPAPALSQILVGKKTVN